MNPYNLGTCIICLNSYKKPIKIFCGHTFCFECINNWSNYSQYNKCPICRKEFNLEITHNYNTRKSHHIQNNKMIMNQMKEYLNDYKWNCYEHEEKIIHFNKIFQYIYDNKCLLKYKKFKKVVLEKIDYLKKENEFIGFYWSQKIY
jgi:hypothetical protein